MECEQLKNYGKLFTAKPSARVGMALFTSVPFDLGFISTPKFLAKYQRQDRRWKKREFKAAQERGITNHDAIESVQSGVLAFYTALIATCGQEKALNLYTKFSEKIGIMMYEEFFPPVKDFLRCREPWQAYVQYLLRFLRSWQEEGIARFQVMQDTESEFQVHLTDCAFNAMYHEAGYPEVAVVGCLGNLRFFTRLSDEMGGDFQRDSWICRGDATCDWHFCRHKVSDR